MITFGYNTRMGYDADAVSRFLDDGGFDLVVADVYPPHIDRELPDTLVLDFSDPFNPTSREEVSGELSPIVSAVDDVDDLEIEYLPTAAYESAEAALNSDIELNEAASTHDTANQSSLPGGYFNDEFTAQNAYDILCGALKSSVDSYSAAIEERTEDLPPIQNAAEHVLAQVKENLRTIDYRPPGAPENWEDETVAINPSEDACDISKHFSSWGPIVKRFLDERSQTVRNSPLHQRRSERYADALTERLQDTLGYRVAVIPTITADAIDRNGSLYQELTSRGYNVNRSNIEQYRDT